MLLRGRAGTGSSFRTPQEPLALFQPLTCPSVEPDKHSVPVREGSQHAPYTGSLWLNSTGVISTGSPPFLVSQYTGKEKKSSCPAPFLVTFP